MQNTDHIDFELAGHVLFPASRASSLALHLGLSRQYVTKLISGKAPLPPSLWLDLLRLTDERLVNLMRLYDDFPNEWKKYGSKGSRAGSCTFSGTDFAKISAAMFGERWTVHLAFRLNMTSEYMRKLAKGQRPLTPRVLRLLAIICRSQIIKLRDLEHRLAFEDFPAEIACDWIVTDRPFSDDEGDGTANPSAISCTIH